MNARLLLTLALVGLLTALGHAAFDDKPKDKDVAPAKDKDAKDKDAKDKDAKDKDAKDKDKDAKDKDAKDKDKGDKPESPKKDALQGTWTVKSAVEGGAAQKEFDKATFTFAGEKLSVALNEKDVLDYTYKLDESKTPKVLELWFGAPAPEATAKAADKGKPAHGIFELNGDALKLCVAPAEEKPPTEFKADQPKVWLFELERAPKK
jgi:uncharacterized protein (TIGR03067 family)